MTITICSDAGVDIRWKLAYWACYIRTPSTKIIKSGVLKQYTTDVCEAEKRGIANALSIVDKLYDLSKYNLIIYCDNINAIKPPPLKRTPASLIYHKRTKAREWWFSYIGNIVNKAKTYEFRHVKGHTKVKNWSNLNASNYMNYVCDKECARVHKQYIRHLKRST